MTKSNGPKTILYGDGEVQVRHSLLTIGVCDQAVPNPPLFRGLDGGAPKQISTLLHHIMSAPTMKAVVAVEHKQVTVLDVPIPKQGPGQILVKVVAVAQNPTDCAPSERF
jgi:hypothetical protein